MAAGVLSAVHNTEVLLVGERCAAASASERARPAAAAFAPSNAASAKIKSMRLCSREDEPEELRAADGRTTRALTPLS